MKTKTADIFQNWKRRSKTERIIRQLAANILFENFKIREYVLQPTGTFCDAVDIWKTIREVEIIEEFFINRNKIFYFGRSHYTCSTPKLYMQLYTTPTYYIQQHSTQLSNVKPRNYTCQQSQKRPIIENMDLENCILLFFWKFQSGLLMSGGIATLTSQLTRITTRLTTTILLQRYWEILRLKKVMYCCLRRQLLRKCWCIY